MLTSKICPILRRQQREIQTCFDCPKVKQNWHLNRLLTDLAEAKGIKYANDSGEIHFQKEIEPRELSPSEICKLSLVLSGIDVQQIDKHFEFRANSTSQIFSRSINKYISYLVDKKVNHWACIPFYLNKYRKDNNRSSNETIEIKLKIPADLERETIDKIFDGLKQVCGVDSLRIDRVEKLDESDEQ